jgi:hypothetical protein
MKNLILTTLLGIQLITVSSCSKDESCSFSKSTFESKTYKNSIVRIDSSGIDVTSRWSSIFTSDPCFNNTTTLNSSGTYTENKDSKCTEPAVNGTWKVYTTNSKNYFVFDKDTTEINSFDCNSLTVKRIESTFSIIVKLTKI